MSPLWFQRIKARVKEGGNAPVEEVIAESSEHATRYAGAGATPEGGEAALDDGAFDGEYVEDFDEELDDDLEAIQERVYGWAMEWSQTPAFEALSDEQKAESEFIIGTFTEYMYNYHGSAPEEWNPRDMEACCLDTLPRKISAEEVYFRSIAPVLSSFFMFLGKTGRLPASSRLVDRLRMIDRKIVQAGNDPRNWGIAKSFLMSAMPAVPRLSAGPAADVETYVRSSPKAGRNEPCPCGSGKKYKKCCGQ